MREKFIEAKRILDKTESILLASHANPDGDALGSMLALKILLRQIGKQADVFCGAQIPEGLKFLPGAGQIKSALDTGYDLVFGVDYGRLSHLETVVLKMDLPLPAITFDHHPADGQFGAITVADTNYSSTCEIVFGFLEANSLKLEREIAICLLAGILDDTWNFRHPNTTARTLQVVGGLLKTGISLSKISKCLNQDNISGKSLLWGKALAKMQMDERGFIYCLLSRQDLKEFQPDAEELLGGLASLLCMVPEAKFALVLTETELGLLKGSLRALPDHWVDVSRLAKAFGGGGHKLSAGFRTTAKPEEVFEIIKELIIAYN